MKQVTKFMRHSVKELKLSVQQPQKTGIMPKPTDIDPSPVGPSDETQLWQSHKLRPCERDPEAEIPDKLCLGC